MRKLKNILTKRRILTVLLIVVVFVMSLGYAALSEHMELDGIAQIDRSWIVKVTNVEASSSNNGVNDSSTFVGTTVTMNATLPTSTSTVTYTITLENKGNLVAKLSSIEKIEDENTNITYTISGVTEGETILRPGETNTITVTIKYASGVTSVSNTKKSIMLNINYVENIEDNIIIPDEAPEEANGYEEYSIGQEVQLIDGTRWYVVSDSSSEEELVTLISKSNSIGNSCRVFDTNGSTMYEINSTTNIGYCINNTIIPSIKSSIENSGGNSAGLTGRLLTLTEFNNIKSSSYPEAVTVVDSSNTTWIMTEASSTSSYILQSGSELSEVLPTTNGSTRPVIIVTKNNVRPVLLREEILLLNNEESDENIDFAQISSDTNGNGLYYTSTNTEDNKVTYYFRGAVDNNYVYFGGFYWRIVRINEDGSVRLIYQGKTVDAKESAASIGTSPFNEGIDGDAYDNAYVGYMYGTPGSSTYEETHANTNDSTIKAFIDDWYEANLKENYSSYLADAGFCNDRSVASSAGVWNSGDTAKGYGTNRTYYGSYQRASLNSPQFACPNPENDLFTLKGGSKGNKALDYPIGMLTIDEAIYAGAKIGTSNVNKDFYLYTGTTSWLISAYYLGSATYQAALAHTGYLLVEQVYDRYNVKPVINLRADIEIMKGIGIANNPYIINP